MKKNLLRNMVGVMLAVPKVAVTTIGSNRANSTLLILSFSFACCSLQGDNKEEIPKAVLDTIVKKWFCGDKKLYDKNLEMKVDGRSVNRLVVIREGGFLSTFGIEAIYTYEAIDDQFAVERRSLIVSKGKDVPPVFIENDLEAAEYIAKNLPTQEIDLKLVLKAIRFFEVTRNYKLFIDSEEDLSVIQTEKEYERGQFDIKKINNKNWHINVLFVSRERMHLLHFEAVVKNGEVEIKRLEENRFGYLK